MVIVTVDERDGVGGGVAVGVIEIFTVCVSVGDEEAVREMDLLGVRVMVGGSVSDIDREMEYIRVAVVVNVSVQFMDSVTLFLISVTERVTEWFVMIVCEMLKDSMDSVCGRVKVGDSVSVTSGVIDSVMDSAIVTVEERVRPVLDSSSLGDTVKVEVCVREVVFVRVLGCVGVDVSLQLVEPDEEKDTDVELLGVWDDDADADLEEDGDRDALEELLTDSDVDLEGVRT